MKGGAFAPALLDIAMVWHHKQELFTYLCTLIQYLGSTSSEIGLVIRTCESYLLSLLEGGWNYFCYHIMKKLTNFSVI